MPLPRQRSGVVFRELPEGAILFCTATETYFSLNPAGSRVWSLLPECQTEDEVVARIATDHSDIDPAVITADVRSLLAELLQNRLVEVQSGS